jgi:hypothetical protein
MRNRSHTDYSFLQHTLYTRYSLTVLLSALNSPHARDEDARAVALTLRRGGLSKAEKRYRSICWQDGKPKSLFKVNTRRDTIKNALQQWLASREPERLRECTRCKSFFFDRSQPISERRCDTCRNRVITRKSPTTTEIEAPTNQRTLPPLDELEQLLSLGHPSEPRHKRFIVDSCSTCRSKLRTFLLTVWLVQSHNNFWKDLVGDLPISLRESFNARSILPGTRQALLALAWCIREADHWHALSRQPFVRLMEAWIGQMKITTWDFLDLTYLPTHNLAFLTQIAKTAHGSSRRRKHASLYWERGGITRYDGTLTSQGFWTACAGPLAVILRPHVRGKTWDKNTPVPRALWREILKLWSLRYPERELPTSEALRRRVVAKQLGKGFRI